MVVSQSVPEHLERQALAIVHISFGRVITEDTVDHDLLLSFAEPSLLTAKPARSLGWRGREVEVSDDPDDAGESSFQGEEPSKVTVRRLWVWSCLLDLPPASETVDTAPSTTHQPTSPTHINQV